MGRCAFCSCKLLQKVGRWKRARAQALSTLKEDSAELKVREADLALLKEVVEPARSKYQQVRPPGGGVV